MVKLLGTVDIIAAVLLLILALGAEVPAVVLAVVSIFLAAKASISLIEIGGITDTAVIILIIMSFFAVLPFWILLIGAGLIGIKGLMSLLA